MAKESSKLVRIPNELLPQVTEMLGKYRQEKKLARLIEKQKKRLECDKARAEKDLQLATQRMQRLESELEKIQVKNNE